MRTRRIRGLPAREYLLAVLPDVDPAQLRNRAFLERLARASLKIALADGERRQQDPRMQQVAPAMRRRRVRLVQSCTSSG